MSMIKEQSKSNFMVITFNVRYDDSIVVPYKEGIALLASLENAKIYHTEYQKESLIRDIKNEDIKTSCIGAQEYGEGILRTTLLAKAEGE